MRSGRSQRSASETFDLNPSTIIRWWLRYKTEGHVNPRKNLGSKPRIDSLLLKDYLDNNADFNLSDISKLFNVSKLLRAIHTDPLAWVFRQFI